MMSVDAKSGRVFAVAVALAGWLVKFVAVVLVIATFNFVLVHAAPGDPAQVIAGQSGASDAKLIAQIRAEYGLDKPYPVQLATYLSRVLSFDLGYSYRQQRSVASLIGERLPANLRVPSRHRPRAGSCASYLTSRQVSVSQTRAR